MKWAQWTTILSLFVFPTSAAFALECIKTDPVFFFGNGMFNSRDSAEESAFFLENVLRLNGFLRPEGAIQLAYNTNEPLLQQLLQVADQKNAEAGSRFYLWLANLSFAPEFFRKEAAKIAEEFSEKVYIKDTDLKIQVERYQAEISSGSLVATLAHSQGNFYANAAWRALQKKKENQGRFSIIGVATPVSSIEGDGPYTTLTQDIIMAAVRLAKGSLPANVTNSSSSASGHEFVSQYLDGNKSGPKIIADLKQTISRMMASFSKPGKSELEYQDPSLMPFLSYACALKNMNRKLTDGECIALAALDRTYSWFGEPREERSVRGLHNWITECAKDFWQDSDRFDFLHCSVLGDGSGLDIQGSGSLKLDFVLSDHPECHWHSSEVVRRASSSAIAEAMRLIENPPQ